MPCQVHAEGCMCPHASTGVSGATDRGLQEDKGVPAGDPESRTPFAARMGRTLRAGPTCTTEN
eukprot:CAMPEP_0174376704 /NCGR_PEP_ID=MMETSP0811_2-20130205/119205_1 /TAXON_ID=73025 ORGANISM="Eutreptiella gymnastica-like, Strain CCMP1594" /NCGR_SAMPLE_ID=MMETSP0811_2 /ASSEMBLY_ACC=CAM_ASM_000667 /LENGTH=62 /DNA_ID=CAMNT_0015528171 /DNA_START=139 /DNA_END=327 /DNA_ORIENTATION=-